MNSESNQRAADTADPKARIDNAVVFARLFQSKNSLTSDGKTVMVPPGIKGRHAGNCAINCFIQRANSSAAMPSTRNHLPNRNDAGCGQFCQTRSEHPRRPDRLAMEMTVTAFAAVAASSFTIPCAISFRLRTDDMPDRSYRAVRKYHRQHPVLRFAHWTAREGEVVLHHAVLDLTSLLRASFISVAPNKIITQHDCAPDR